MKRSLYMSSLANMFRGDAQMGRIQDNRKTLYRKAIDKWGMDFQIKMVAEECAELIKAVLKLNRKLNASTKDNVLDEMADVYIMLDQLQLILEDNFHINAHTSVCERIEIKLKRLEGMLKA